MKEKKITTKKAKAFLLAVAMIVTSFPAFSTTVHATELPDSTQFATVDELKNFNTNDNDGEVNPAKVYFGNNNQKWWIVGSQSENSIVLFAVGSLEKIYFYTNSEGGLRHSLLDESKVDQADAKFMLVSCSAFVNYIISKLA